MQIISSTSHGDVLISSEERTLVGTLPQRIPTKGLLSGQGKYYLGTWTSAAPESSVCSQF